MSLVEEFRQEQEETLRLLRAYKAEMHMIRDGLNGGIVCWASINKVKEGEPFVLIDSILAYRMRSADPHVIIFKVVMGPRSRFRHHEHDCTELGQLWSGDVIVNGRQLPKLGVYYVEAGEGHELYSEEGCELVVQFVRS